MDWRRVVGGLSLPIITLPPPFALLKLFLFFFLVINVGEVLDLIVSCEMLHVLLSLHLSAKNVTHV